jgi:hypothetical protein
MASLSKTLIKALLSGGINGHGPKRKKYYHSVMAVAIPIGGGIADRTKSRKQSALLHIFQLDICNWE